MSLYSAGVEYGIHCLIFLVGNGGETREASVRDLAELQGVPLDYLAKIFTKLAKAKLVVATEGVRGGSSWRGRPMRSACWTSSMRSTGARPFSNAGKFAVAAHCSRARFPSGRWTALARYTAPC